MTGSRFPQKYSSRRLVGAVRALALTALALSSGGCFFAAQQEAVSSIPADYRLRHPIAVTEGERSVMVFIGTRRGGLTPAQRAEVLAFAGAWRREATGGIVIDVPVGTPNAHAAADAAHEMRAILAGAGVPPQAIQSHGYRPADPALLASVKLNYPRMAAQAGPCGVWPDDLGPTLDAKYNRNEPYWNLGCAMQRNLAAMVENPADIAQPRAETPVYTARRTQAIEKYRKGESPATVYPNADKGTISDIGK
jgi:pilus assembly protein CpaD